MGKSVGRFRTNPKAPCSGPWWSMSTTVRAKLGSMIGSNATRKPGDKGVDTLGF